MDVEGGTDVRWIGLAFWPILGGSETTRTTRPTEVESFLEDRKVQIICSNIRGRERRRPGGERIFLGIDKQIDENEVEEAIVDTNDTFKTACDGRNMCLWYTLRNISYTRCNTIFHA